MWWDAFINQRRDAPSKREPETNPALKSGRRITFPHKPDAPMSAAIACR